MNLTPPPLEAVGQGGVRLDTQVALIAHTSRAAAKELVEAGRVLVNGQQAKPAQRLRGGETIVIYPFPVVRREILPERLPLTILYQDQFLAAIDKPPGLVVHPAPGAPAGTLVNALLAALPDLSQLGGEERPGIVHRLDKDTSGVILVAKDDASHRRLAEAFQSRQVQKEYLAIVDGDLSQAQLIEASIGRSPRNRKHMTVGGLHPRPARTELVPLERFLSHTLVRCRPTTGRTHQIRVHLRFIGHPVTGDRLYGRPSPLINRQALHAHRLRFPHPHTGQVLECVSPLPPDLEAALGQLRRQER
ncbi:MAG: RluA family pseudouridine synthase [Deinococcus sp.]|nr:RluA family pseudouridine synthase [Deinococcus sp.]